MEETNKLALSGILRSICGQVFVLVLFRFVVELNIISAIIGFIVLISSTSQIVEEQLRYFFRSSESLKFTLSLIDH